MIDLRCHNYKETWKDSLGLSASLPLVCLWHILSSSGHPVSMSIDVEFITTTKLELYSPLACIWRSRITTAYGIDRCDGG